MNKQEFVAAVAAEAQVSQKDAGDVINAALAVIEKTLAKGGEVVLTGFGKFVSRKRAARNGINPLTQKPVKIAACNVPAFKAGKGLKEAVNK
ncbi:MAG: HU family DNA-binding protein [Firmicutes bacterium]|nr:HU family DNA-binding protein [Bacillota bacterium]